MIEAQETNLKLRSLHNTTKLLMQKQREVLSAPFQVVSKK